MKEDEINAFVKEVIEARSYGEVIHHHEIMDIMKVTKRDNKYRHCVARANRILTEKGKRLQNRFNVGYIVLNPDDYIDEAESQYKRGSRRAKEAMRVLTFAPVALMTEESREHYNAISNKIMAVVATVVGGLTEIKLLNRRKVKINKI